ncbi:sterol desaturase family protein [Anabaena sp. UHCC 0187]|uniref:sterol desaturase family protein n=1 Tax=Anabaena sp. UHCC 0187 TaxID=2590018 RepID=UPI001445C29D|nr:sterol desaturase family protein [Anabaena sp. UHCC 0187]MTJ13309.1 sterol desaturase family protein [Anabaena sp. UHCC 0187]
MITQIQNLRIFYPFLVPFISSSEIHWLYILSALLLALVIYKLGLSQQDEQINLRQYLLPKAVYLHPSAIAEYKYYFLSSFLEIFVILPIILSLPNLANIICHYLTEITHLTTPFFITHPQWYHYVTLSIVVALAGDFAYYCYHYLAHRSSFFWEFHKVHHSADVLTPMTVYRSHPFDLLLSMIFAMAMLGFTTGIWIYLFGNQVSHLSIYGVDWEIFLFYLTGANLRHSHIWLNYPYKVSHVFMSPAQHHIHHSVEPKHYDKNFGYILSFWDWIFGTLYVPRNYEKLSFGLANGESNLFNSVTNMLLQPLRSIGQRINKKVIS